MAQETVSRPYATYEWYTDEYHGKIVTEEDFPRFSRMATSIIDAMTYGNIKSDDMVTDCVRDATCAVAELAMNYHISTIESEGGRSMSSETNDGYSVSYGDALSTSKSMQVECLNTLKLYLAGSGLLCRVAGKRPRRWYRA